jgi:hypothetical protein
VYTTTFLFTDFFGNRTSIYSPSCSANTMTDENNSEVQELLAKIADSERDLQERIRLGDELEQRATEWERRVAQEEEKLKLLQQRAAEEARLLAAEKLRAAEAEQRVAESEQRALATYLATILVDGTLADPIDDVWDTLRVLPSPLGSVGYTKTLRDAHHSRTSPL